MYTDCSQGQMRCFFNSSGEQCCNFYLEDECVAECCSPLVNDSNFDCGENLDAHNWHNLNIVYNIIFCVARV